MFGIRLLGIFSEHEISFEVKDGIKKGSYEDLETFAIKNNMYLFCTKRDPNISDEPKTT